MTAQSRNSIIGAAAMGLFLIGGASAAQTSPAAADRQCPPWADTGDRHTNYGTAAAGCSDFLNLVHMVEDKRDLVHGRTLGPGDAERELLAIQNYEAGKVKDAKTQETGGSALYLPTAVQQGTSQ